MMQFKFISVFFILLCISLFGCNITPTSSPASFVTIPASDTTPPTVGMIINDGNKINVDINQSSASQTPIKTNSNVVSVVAGATDLDGGIKKVMLWTTFTHFRPGQIQGPGLAGSPIKQDISNARVGEPTQKNRFFLHNFDLKQELGSWESVKLDVWVEGENFHGGKARTPIISIIYP